MIISNANQYYADEVKPERMKKKNRRRSEAEEPLCCCEYIDRDGKKNHLAACFCNCEDLDEACDRWITCKSLQPDTLQNITETFSDRFRIPWLRGAKKVDVSFVLPLVLLPVCLHVAALHLLLTIIILSSLPVLVLWYYYFTHRKKGRTLFFLSLGLFSLGYMYYIFLQKVVSIGHIENDQVIIVTCGLLLTLATLAQAKKDPGYLHSTRECVLSSSKNYREPSSRKWTKNSNGFHKSQSANDSSVHIEVEPSSMLDESSACAKRDWCTLCNLVRPYRAGHCRTCNACVRRLDHHCVWIDSCIGESNHHAFILLILFFLMTSVYGITLTLGTICSDHNAFVSLFYCPGVYADHSSALVFTCVWYSTIITAGMSHVLLIQLLNISFNVTEREARLALKEKIGRRFFCSLVVDPEQYNLGFFQNWNHFLTLGCSQQQNTVDLV
uniref:Palmitoyltransferase n=1 Tax=Geotrypetes seraphini TaxID=260995 RepID=A0A6P8RDI9_GEOSA|nr:palmitoyltransferase ZDHHC23 [Geotrypetes seraphini]XP_033798501.1 palmitoyltransferase ZDHHC23 [Geotrypetes seraphini]XP_033798502.1 palmitoyltransferase ZDHHC23 [Geotrypetes seraphini]XP_033798504.1 palmitoyltransferase ZDHHC23 [Geotrypetes seraphini]